MRQHLHVQPRVSGAALPQRVHNQGGADLHEGFTAREAVEELASDGRKPHYATVYRWVRDFTRLVAGYVRKIGAQAGYVWSTDEIVRDMLA